LRQHVLGVEDADEVVLDASGVLVSVEHLVLDGRFQPVAQVPVDEWIRELASPSRWRLNGSLRCAMTLVRSSTRSIS
ncbi:MAG: hypothetical protein ACXV3F_15015, partial [Frankiaceae bacterium]